MRAWVLAGAIWLLGGCDRNFAAFFAEAGGSDLAPSDGGARTGDDAAVVDRDAWFDALSEDAIVIDLPSLEDAEAADLASEPDVPPADLAGPADFVAPADSLDTSDLSASPDLAELFDLTPLDLAIPDLTPTPDLPELTYRPSGVQVNVPLATVTAGAWTQCYKDTYGLVFDLPIALRDCTQANLMLACRRNNSTTLQVLAWAPRTDVLTDTQMKNTPHDANGVGWYYSDSYSWGFAPRGDTILLGQCDTGSADPTRRLCWHTIKNNNYTGYRCGSDFDLSDNKGFDRLIFQSD